MSYTGSDDQAICDGPCGAMYPDGWPDWITPWPVAGPVLVDGRLSADRRDTFNICWPCLRSLILKARLPLDGHELAVSSSRRWEASQKLRAEAEAAFKGPRSPDRPGRRPAA